MAIVNELVFTRPQLSKFAGLLRAARQRRGLTQLQVANKAFAYTVSHCKVSRVERCVMRKVDAYAIARMASALGVPKAALSAIDPDFHARLKVARVANKQGFWHYRAQ